MKYAIEIMRGHYVYSETLETAIVTAGMHGDAVIREIVQNSPLLTFSDDHVRLPDGECVPQCYCCVRVVGEFVAVLDQRQNAIDRKKPITLERLRYSPAKVESMVELESSMSYMQRIMEQRIKSMKVLAQLKPENLR